jgi:hypothetical protein
MLDLAETPRLDECVSKLRNDQRSLRGKKRAKGTRRSIVPEASST